MGVCSDERNRVDDFTKEDFGKRYPSSYGDDELNQMIDRFIESSQNNKQESFFMKHTNDQAFELLKNEEKNILLNYFNSKKSIFITAIQNKINGLKLNDDYNQIIIDIIKIEEGERIYKDKIIREITKINNDINKFKIDFLTIMLVGQSGVGKSTLINQFLKLKGKEKAKTGTGEFVTTETKGYRSDEIRYLRLIDTRGIELNANYGAKEVQEEATKFIREQLDTNNINNFVSCIWYCITGVRYTKSRNRIIKCIKRLIWR